MNISSSQLILASIQKHLPQSGLVVPPGEPCKYDTWCTACGTPIQKDDAVIWKLPVGKTFTDWQYLAHERCQNQQLPFCPSCATVFTGEYLEFQKKNSNAVFSLHGAWKIGTDAERKWFFLDPPEPPFVAYIAKPMGMHIAWRSPITLDKNLIRMAVSRRHITINRPRLLEASNLCFELTTQLRHHIPITPNHPFKFLDRSLEDHDHGVLRDDLKSIMLDLGLKQEIMTLESLSLGELFGLSVLNKAKQETATQTSIATLST